MIRTSTCVLGEVDEVDAMVVWWMSGAAGPRTGLEAVDGTA